LIAKLEAIGTLLKWIKDYLANRELVVTIGGTASMPKPINVGVLQGSILGPLPIIYIDKHCNPIC
jgi:hypothetical protein